jgi:hypothetical protein
MDIGDLCNGTTMWHIPILLLSGAAAALPSRTGNTRRDRIRSAGASACFAMAPFMIAGLRQSTDSLQLLGSALNNKFFSIKKVEIKFYVISLDYLLTVDFSKNYITEAIVKHLHKHHMFTSGK